MTKEQRINQYFESNYDHLVSKARGLCARMGLPLKPEEVIAELVIYVSGYEDEIQHLNQFCESRIFMELTKQRSKTRNLLMPGDASGGAMPDAIQAHESECIFERARELVEKMPGKMRSRLLVYLDVRDMSECCRITGASQARIKRDMWYARQYHKKQQQIS